MPSAPELVITPDLGVIVPPEDMPHATLRERAAAACKTIHVLLENGLDPETLVHDPQDDVVVEKLLTSYAKDEEATNKSMTPAKFSAMRPAAILQLEDALQEFSHVVVRNAVQIRTFVTNKLLQEASNPDPRVRIRALELLGKISDVGLFTERSEVTVTHRSTDDLKQSLREKLQALRSKALKNDVEDANVINSTQFAPVDDVPLVVDLDAELGMAPEELN
jgi:hypothetical protein